MQAYIDNTFYSKIENGKPVTVRYILPVTSSELARGCRKEVAVPRRMPNGTHDTALLDIVIVPNTREGFTYYFDDAGEHLRGEKYQNVQVVLSCCDSGFSSNNNYGNNQYISSSNVPYSQNQPYQQNNYGYNQNNNSQFPYSNSMMQNNSASSLFDLSRKIENDVEISYEIGPGGKYDTFVSFNGNYNVFGPGFTRSISLTDGSLINIQGFNLPQVQGQWRQHFNFFAPQYGSPLSGTLHVRFICPTNNSHVMSRNVDYSGKKDSFCNCF